REFLTGQGLFAFFDAPWMPLYFGLVFMIHPILGVVSIIGGIVIFFLALANEVSTRDLLKEASTSAIGAQRFVDASLRNVEALEAMGMLGSMHKRWQAKRASVIRLQAKASDRAGMISAGSKLVRMVLQMAILGVGAYLVIQN